ncbi:MAG TPA: hypothetical protein PKJ99_02665 [Thermoanaerobaculales bacterium]|nr:hypothetical protein [Thermoanaerobaculales bacterium]HPA82684.1 hypothetical protein [Thermoanaerobaculales bacterium]HQL31033.1 hypothetical protein [Thermoanaerobaculales bacterium]HQN95475.1 hypothetical protein [Thermoanaerobaculales bacterium]HQP42196.1 hypothetical protein [Thermoanaerobaculales bacterium]
MRRQFVAVVAVGVVVLGLAGGVAWAGSQVEVDVRFDFIVNGQEMPAGSYTVQVNGDRVVIKGATGGAGTEIPVITRLADRELPNPKLFFDKTKDGKHYLAELQLPGMDGFLFKGATGEHIHEAVTGQGLK